MSNPPLVSVIVPAYNAESFLGDAVESVLRQTWADLELVIVDDGSTDRTGELADAYAQRDPRVRIIRKRNGGLSSARNAGIAAATGEFLCFLDADDMFLPDKIERQVRFLLLFPTCGLVYSDHYVGDSTLTPLMFDSKLPPPIPMRELLAYRNWFAPMSPLLRASLVEKVGQFDEALTSSEDWDFWIRASECTAFSYMPGPVGVYRTHPGQMHKNWQRMRTNQAKVISKHFPRRSTRWRIARASIDAIEARRHWGRGEYARMLVSLVSCVWHARSRRTVRNALDLTRS